MILADKLMIKNCYANSKLTAWFISSVFGSVFGLILTIVLWTIVALLDNEGTFLMIVKVSLNLFFWDGIILFVAGLLAIQVLYHYFASFTKDAPIGTIAGWIASTPLFIFLATIVLTFFSDTVTFFSYTGREKINNLFLVGFIIAIIGLIVFEKRNGIENISQINTHYRGHIFLIILFFVLYSITLEVVLSKEHAEYSNLMSVIALLPYYWIGFGTGIRVLFKENQRIILRHNWRNTVKNHLPLIVILEVIGMLVFFFEYLGLSKQSATVVSLVAGVHIVLVYILDLIIFKKKIEVLNTLLILTISLGMTIAVISVI